MTQDLGAEVTPPIPPAETRILQEEAERHELTERIEKAIKGNETGKEPKHKMSLVDLVQHMPYTSDYNANFPNNTVNAIPARVFDRCGTRIYLSASATYLMYGARYFIASSAPALDEVSRFADRVSVLREELEKDEPDLKLVDNLYSEFFYERLEHFVTTVDQRVQSRTQEGTYDPGDQGLVPESMRQLVIDSMSRKKLYLGERLEDAKKLRPLGKEFRASKLAAICEEVDRHTATELGPYGSDVFSFDNFSTDPKQQRQAVLHEQEILGYEIKQNKAQQRMRARALRGF